MHAFSCMPVQVCVSVCVCVSVSLSRRECLKYGAGTCAWHRHVASEYIYVDGLQTDKGLQGVVFVFSVGSYLPCGMAPFPAENFNSC